MTATATAKAVAAATATALHSDGLSGDHKGGRSHSNGLVTDTYQDGSSHSDDLATDATKAAAMAVATAAI